MPDARILQIERAIRQELDYSTQAITFSVKGRTQDGPIWKLTVSDAGNNRGRSALDESLEEAAVWWPGPPKGTASVLSVVPEESVLYLRFASETPPASGMIQIYPPRFLDALLEHWEDEDRARWSLDWFDRVRGGNSYDQNDAVDSGQSPRPLRAAQAEAFDLPGWDLSFLWGPPGTGKTYTLGSLLACYSALNPSRRVLLLSTTNWAVDLALLSVDDALDGLKDILPGAKGARQACVRIGNHFVAKNYTGRKHLLPAVDEEVVRRLADVEAQRPAPENARAYDRWKTQVEQLRKKTRANARGALARSRLAAMTTTGAAFLLDELIDQAPFDLVFFDEASQVGLAHALALAPLGRKTVFAGDPRQLAPVVQSDDPDAVEWLGKSMFRYMQGSAPETCMLTEQSRMAEPICRLVSNVFYDGRLTVAEDAALSESWHQERHLEGTADLYAEAAEILVVDEDGTWSRKYGGPVRLASANLICRIVEGLKEDDPEMDILVLTPFRAQRTLIRSCLRRERIRDVRVSTVHRAQGSECNTVIFDPADGKNKWLESDEVRPLINVGLSRAKARLVLLFSKGDCENPLIQQICMAVEHGDKDHDDAQDISVFVNSPGFPSNAVGQKVRISRLVGEVLRVEVDCFILLDFVSGKEKRIKTQFVINKFRSKTEYARSISSKASR